MCSWIILETNVIMNTLTIEKEPEVNAIYKQGSVWIDRPSMELYLLCYIGESSYRAISLSTGNRWASPSTFHTPFTPQEAVHDLTFFAENVEMSIKKIK